MLEQVCTHKKELAKSPRSQSSVFISSLFFLDCSLQGIDVLPLASQAANSGSTQNVFDVFFDGGIRTEGLKIETVGLSLHERLQCFPKEYHLFNSWMCGSDLGLHKTSFQHRYHITGYQCRVWIVVYHSYAFLRPMTVL